MKNKLMVVCSFLLLVISDLYPLLEDREDSMNSDKCSKSNLNHLSFGSRIIKRPVYNAEFIRIKDFGFKLKLHCDPRQLREIFEEHNIGRITKNVETFNYCIEDIQYNCYILMGIFLKRHFSINFASSINTDIFYLIKSGIIRVNTQYSNDNYLPIKNVNFTEEGIVDTCRYLRNGLNGVSYFIKYNLSSNKSLNIDCEDEIPCFITKWIEYKYFEIKDFSLLLQNIESFYECLTIFRKAPADFLASINIISFQKR